MNKNYKEEIEKIMDKLEEVDIKSWEIHRKIKEKKQEYMDLVEIEDLDEFMEKASETKKEIKDLEDEDEKLTDINNELLKDLDTIEIDEFVQEELINPSKELLELIARKADEKIGLSEGGLAGFDEDRLSFHMDMVESSIERILIDDLSYGEYTKELEETIYNLRDTVELQKGLINQLERKLEDVESIE